MTAQRPDPSPSPIFDDHREAYLKRLADLDLAAIAGRLALAKDPDGLIVPLFSRSFHVSPRGIFDPDRQPASYAAFVIICRHLLMCPAREPEDAAWTAFRDFKDAGPLLVYFANSVEGAITKAFAGRPEALQQAGTRMGGQILPPGQFAYDVVMGVAALPKVPVLLLFNDATEGFAPRCVVLFERRIATYLDMETVAVVGAYLADGLARRAKDPWPMCQ